MDVSIGKTSLAVGRLELDLGMQILHDANPPYDSPPITYHLSPISYHLFHYPKMGETEPLQGGLLECL